METQQVLEKLKPKAASFGFSEEELREASENIAGLHPEEATDEEVTKAVDTYIPILKLSQSAANRSFERFKTQFEKDHPKPTKTPEQEEAERKAKEEAERKKKEEEEKRKKEEEKEPEWFKSYREASEKRIKDLEEANSRLESEKTDAGFRKAAIEALEGVDESYYDLLLKQQKFTKQEDVDNFVKDVKEGWEKMSSKLKINNLSSVKPPKGGTPPSDKPSKDVEDRIKRRKASGAVTSPIRGIEQKK